MERRGHTGAFWLALGLIALPGVAQASESSRAWSPVCTSVPWFDGGAARGAVCADQANDAGLTVLDLSDDWLPSVLSETTDRPQPLRRQLVDLANERFGRGDAVARRDAHFELYGIPPSIGVVARRLLDEARHACRDQVRDGALAAVPPRRTAPLSGPTGAAVKAHLRCEGTRTRPEALRRFQRRHALPDHGRLDLQTRITLVTDSREMAFRTLLRALRERVADAAGLIEDGSARGQREEVLGRTLDSDEFLPTVPSAGDAGAPDLVARATEAAARALGWTSPEAASAALQATDRPARVAVRLHEAPAYHGAMMALRVEIDRGEVVLAPPSLPGRPAPRKVTPRLRPTMTLWARDGRREVALVRWPTTIGGWKPSEGRDGEVALVYKESRTGPAAWRDLFATPTWHPPPGVPAKRLLVRRHGKWEVKRQTIGPGYRAAYGLAAFVHHQLVPRTGPGGPALVDYRIRTHGTPHYRSITRGESRGCHRLWNQALLRMAGFLLRHRDHVRHGIAREAYVRHFVVDGEPIPLTIDRRGYRFEFTPPIPVNVLEGQVRGSHRLARRAVPIPVVD